VLPLPGTGARWGAVPILRIIKSDPDIQEELLSRDGLCVREPDDDPKGDAVTTPGTWRRDWTRSLQSAPTHRECAALYAPWELAWLKKHQTLSCLCSTRYSLITGCAICWTD
jgi:hypothetical protein